MISIITTKRLAELLAKERRADEITDPEKLASAWRQLPGINVPAELDALNIQLTNAERLCELGSPVRSLIADAQRITARLIKASV